MEFTRVRLNSTGLIVTLATSGLKHSLVVLRKVILCLQGLIETQKVSLKFKVDHLG